jgi:hypothetical protein
MERSIHYFDVIFSERPRREFNCVAKHMPLVIIASDAQADPGSQPGCGYMMLDARTGERHGRCCSIPEDLLQAWGYGKAVRDAGGNPIAICEAAVIAAAIVAEGEALAGCEVVWFVDNTTALYAFVAGTSANASVERASHIVHFVAYRWNIRIWFEFIDSGGNWADGVSRDLQDDMWARRHRFEVRNLDMTALYWMQSLPELWRSLGIDVGVRSERRD